MVDEKGKTLTAIEIIKSGERLINPLQGLVDAVLAPIIEEIIKINAKDKES